MALSFVIADEFTAKFKRTLASVVSDGALRADAMDFEVLNAVLSAQIRGRLPGSRNERDHRPPCPSSVTRDRRCPPTALSRSSNDGYDGAYRTPCP
jgi:hypothetical protein